MMRAGVLFAALVATGCRFEVAAVGDVRSDGDGGVLSDLGVPDLASGGGGGADLKAPADLAPPPDLVDPCAATPVPIANGVVARCAIGNPPTINGRIEEWVTTPSYTLRSGATSVVEAGFTGSAGDRDLNLSGSFQLRWDETNLYVAVTVVDDMRAVAISNTALWQGDSVEIYLSSTGAGQYGANDLQFVLAPGGAGSYYRGDGVARAIPPGVTVMSRDFGGAHGWEMEVSIPWSLIGGQGTIGRLVRFDLQLNDADLSPTRERFLMWRLVAPAMCNECSVIKCQPSCSTATFDRLQLGGR